MGIRLLSVWAHGLVDYPLQQRPGIAAWSFVLLVAHRRKINGEKIALLFTT
jgi:hypothetical protein